MVYTVNCFWNIAKRKHKNKSDKRKDEQRKSEYSQMN